LAVTLGLTITQVGHENTGFNNMVVVDGFAAFINILLLASGLLGIALAYGYIKRMGLERGEYYILMLFSIVGMMLMAQASDLIIVFLALELLSIPLYVLAAFARPKLQSEEAGVKYFLLGAFSTGRLCSWWDLASKLPPFPSTCGLLTYTKVHQPLSPPSCHPAQRSLALPRYCEYLPPRSHPLPWTSLPSSGCWPR
jgi:hypothetical protein